jgi:hypothetical protein
MIDRIIFLAFILVICLTACGSSGEQTPEALPVPATPDAVITETPAALPAAGALVEAIQILEPGPGSQVSTPLHVAGIADPTFEQNLVVRVLDENGTQLALAPTTIQAEAGQRGLFAIDLTLPADAAGPLFLQVYATSARDGGITHLDAAIVNLVTPGSEQIHTLEPASERIQILSPGIGQTISGGVLLLEGYGWASFEQTLVVELYDEQGNRITMQPVIVQSPEMGQPGQFRAELNYTLDAPQAGRMVVRDPSAAFEGDVHLSSVELRLEP